jgi:hypothetical protein
LYAKIQSHEKTCTYLYALRCFLSSVFAQRVDLDRFNFTASFRDFPDEPLPNEYKTYNIVSKHPPLWVWVIQHQILKSHQY